MLDLLQTPKITFWVNWLVEDVGRRNVLLVTCLTAEKNKPEVVGGGVKVGGQGWGLNTASLHLAGMKENSK